MHRKGLSGVGLTEGEGGPLIGNLSMSDLRGLTPDRRAARAVPAACLLLACCLLPVFRSLPTPSPPRCAAALPLLNCRRFGALALPVGAFLLLQKGAGLRWEDCLTDQLPPAVAAGRWAGALAGLPVVACGPETTFKEAITQLVDHNKHR